MELNVWDKQYIRDNKDLIDDGNWDEFFNLSNCYDNGDFRNIYQFLYFEAEIDLLHKMSYIPELAFAWCDYRLGDLVIPSNIKKIETGAFTLCNFITSIDLSRTSIKEVPSRCFEQSRDLKKVVLPKTCETIGIYAFSDCSSLESINLEEVKKLDEGSFWWCNNLHQIKLNNFVKLGSTVPDIFWKTFLYDITTPEEYAEEFRNIYPDADVKVI